MLVRAAVSFRASSLALLDPTLPGEVVSVPTFQAARPPVLDALGVGEVLGVGGVPGAGIHRPHHAGAALSCVEVVEAASSPGKQRVDQQDSTIETSSTHQPVIATGCPFWSPMAMFRT